MDKAELEKIKAKKLKQIKEQNLIRK